jgi:hypothetical protein
MLRIPSEHLQAFKVLISLSPDQVNQLASFVEQLPLGIGPTSYGNAFFETFGQSEIPALVSLANMLYSFGALLAEDDNRTSIEGLVEAVVLSFQRLEEEERSEEEIETLKIYITGLFEHMQGLKTTFKSFYLMSANERVYRESRICTDVRLLFQDDITDTRRQGLVTHQLKLNVEEDGAQSDYYFSLSGADLIKLKDQVERALEKERLIKQDYEATVDFINITD